MINPIRPINFAGAVNKSTKKQNIKNNSEKKFTFRDLDKKEKIKIAGIAGASLALTVGITVAMCKKSKSAQKIARNQNGIYSSLNNKIKEQEKIIQSQIDEIAQKETDILSQQEKIAAQAEEIEKKIVFEKKQDSEIDELRKIISELIEVPENSENLHSKYVAEYTQKANEYSIDYDPLKPPVDDNEGFVIKYAKQIFNLKDITPLEEIATKESEIIDTAALKQKLNSTGNLTVEIGSNKKIQAVQMDDAPIGSSCDEILGRAFETDMTIKYGQRINWSEEKIARDIMQNFYDGHKNTLDGVTVKLEEMPNGKTKIRIDGYGLFNYENLRFIGSGTKEENPFNAGGFGEGAKILVANILGNNYSDKITYKCADWQMDFARGKKAIERTLNKVDYLNGNCIEFETSNKKLTDAIIDSINYFRHSQNPDFEKLNFDSRSFGFKIAPTEGEKGNIYLTQRFEFEKQGTWDEALDNLTLIFKRKPDAEEYKRITGCELPKDRDRTHLSFEDIENLTKYFATKEMSDEEIIRAIINSKPLWGTDAIPLGAENSALKSFLNGLLNTARSRKLAIDIGDEKYACYAGYTNPVIIEKLTKEYGYRLLPDEFSNVRIPSASDIFNMMNVHTPIAPDGTEVKKIKLLDQALEILADDFEIALKKHIQNPELNIIPNHKIESTWSYREILDYFGENDQDIVKCIEAHKEDDVDCIASLCRYFPSEAAKLALSKAEQKMRTITNIHDTETKNFLRLIKGLEYHDELDIKSQKYLTTLYDYGLVTKKDAKKPKFIFDRHNELSSNTLGQSIVDDGQYLGHWVDKEYLDNAKFDDILATWVHEVCHKSGGDGEAKFTYALTDLIRILLKSKTSNPITRVKLSAIEEIYNKL